MRTQSILLLTGLALLTFSCKKIKDKRLTIGDEKKMEVTEVNQKVNTHFIGTLAEAGEVYQNLDLDNDGTDDIKLQLYFGSETWLENEDDPLSWSLTCFLLNPDFSIREIVGSNLMYHSVEASAEEIDGINYEQYDTKVGCDYVEGGTELISPSYIQPGYPDGKFETDNGKWSQDPGSYSFFIAHSEARTTVISDESISDDLHVTLNTIIERNCYSVDKTRPVYLQFKTANEEYRLGWIEFIFDATSYTISRHALSKKVIKE